MFFEDDPLGSEEALGSGFLVESEGLSDFPVSFGPSPFAAPPAELDLAEPASSDLSDPLFFSSPAIFFFSPDLKSVSYQPAPLSRKAAT